MNRHDISEILGSLAFLALLCVLVFLILSL
jgi:hypothetical protein